MENFAFWDFEVWGTVNLLAVLFFSLFTANALKRIFPILKRSLIPSSVLGGILLLIVASIYEAIAGENMFNTSFFGGDGAGTLEIITYHGLGLGFIATTLKPSEAKFSKKRSAEIFDSGVATVATYLIQGMFGLGLTLIISLFIKDFFAASGVILPFGYGQGTGQALNYGGIYEADYGFAGGRSFGLTIAAFGFLSASIGGVIHLNILRKKNPSLHWSDENGVLEKLELRDVQPEGDIPMNGSMDKLTVQLMFIFVGYLMAFGMMHLLGGLISSFKSLFFGLNYLLGVVAALIIKAVNKFLMKKGFVQKQHINAFMMTRISGFFFDLMIVSGIAAIKINLLKDYWIVLLVLGLMGALVTYFYDHFVSQKLFPGYTEAQFLMLYGMLTGTASTGIILLRQLDPEFKTPAAENMVYLNFPAIAFGFPMMLLAAIAPAQPLMTFIYMVLFFAALNLILFRNKIFHRRKKNGKNEWQK